MSDIETTLAGNNLRERTLVKKVGKAMTDSFTKGQEAGVIRLNTALINFMNENNKFVLKFDDMQKVVEIVRQEISEDTSLEDKI
jgi:hypothetical protein